MTLPSTRIVVLACAAAMHLFVSTGWTAETDRPTISADGIWRAVDRAAATGAGQGSWVRPRKYRAVALEQAALENALRAAPIELSAHALQIQPQITLPMPDGAFARFRFVESPVMEPELAAKFPQIKTYLGQGIDDPAASVRFDWTPAGFHAQILSPSGAVYIDPLSKGDIRHYASYFKRDYRAAAEPFRCTMVPGPQHAQAPGPDVLSSGETLRTYRLACAATGEYTSFHGGTVSAGMAAITTAVNRVTGIYEVEVAVRLILVGNNDLIVYTNSASDPYTNSNGSAMLSQNQSNLNSVIGSANYDIGHVFSTGGGGIAGVGVVCSNAKAQGVTGLPSPIGDVFYVDFVSHEMGHQFGGLHTFNSTTGSCCCGNRISQAAYETGSASTIQGYAGICGSDNLQPNSDPYFHSESFRRIRLFVTGSADSCASSVSTGNAPPIVNAGLDYTIPRSTPFVLTADGSDPDGDTTTYGWEQRDLGPPQSLSSPDNGSSPLFRSWLSTMSPSRTFPRLSNLLNNTTPLGERLPTTSRTMDFRVTIRDNHAGGGGVDFDDMVVTVDADSGPFTVTAPNTGSQVWSGVGTVSWNVAGTDGAPVSAGLVNILLSDDGGNTFSMVLASNTPNDGTELVSVPNTATTTARVKVEAVGNIFFDISNFDFTIEASDNPPGQATSPLPADTASGIPIVQILTWAPGAFSGSHDVYLGTDPSPGAGQFQGNQMETSFDPGVLQQSTTYYWRIDELNSNGTTAGDVWSFTTQDPGDEPCLPPTVTANIASRYIRIAPDLSGTNPVAFRIGCGSTTEWVELIRTDYSDGEVLVNIGRGVADCASADFLTPAQWTSNGANALYVTGLAVAPGSKPTVTAVCVNCAGEEATPATAADQTWAYCDSSGDGEVTFFLDLFKQFSNTAGAGFPNFTGPSPGIEVDTQGDSPTVPDQQITFFADIFACFVVTDAGGGASWTGDSCPGLVK
ncbi:MAG: zinc-dependent metalloprotease family protein [Phycisphaerae bacterium]